MFTFSLGGFYGIRIGFSVETVIPLGRDNWILFKKRYLMSGGAGWMTSRTATLPFDFLAD